MTDWKSDVPDVQLTIKGYEVGLALKAFRQMQRKKQKDARLSGFVPAPGRHNASEVQAGHLQDMIDRLLAASPKAR